MLLFLLLIGRYLDARLRLKTGQSAQRLAAMQASNASLVSQDGTVSIVPAAMISLMICFDSLWRTRRSDVEIIHGTSDIDTSIASGETLPVRSGPGDIIYSGHDKFGRCASGKSSQC